MKRTILLVVFVCAGVFFVQAEPSDSINAGTLYHAVDFTTETNTYLQNLGFILANGRIKAPDFTLQDLAGKQRSLSSFRGKVVFLNFWGVWCYYCREEMPSLQKFYDRMKSKGLEIVAVNVQDTEQTARDYIVKNKHTFTVLLDKEYKAVNLYGPRGYPTTFLVDREGYLQAMLVGARTWDTPEVYAAFEKILASP
jgi:peroxiredoxin